MHQLPGGGDEGRARVDPDHLPVRLYAARDVSRDDTAATANVEDTLAWPQLHQRQVLGARGNLVLDLGTQFQASDEVLGFFPTKARGVTKQADAAVFRAMLLHRITSSARDSSDCGIVSPSALAVLRLMTSSNFVGCSMGRSAGFAPFRILSTSRAALRQSSASSAP